MSPVFEHAVVSHSRFGAGQVVSLEGTHLRIRFDATGEERVFAYPEAFFRFLATEDAALAGDVSARMAAVKAEKDAALQSLHETVEALNQERKAVQAEARKKRTARKK